MPRYASQIALAIAIALSLGVSWFSGQLDAYYLDIALNVGINIILAAIPIDGRIILRPMQDRPAQSDGTR